jgi:hypothetical protein
MKYRESRGCHAIEDYLTHHCRRYYLYIYLGIILGRVGSGRVERKPDSIFCCPGLARPGCRAAFSCPSPAHRLEICRAVGPSGRAFSKSLFFPSQAWPDMSIGPGNPAQAWPDSLFWPDGPGHQAGLPMPSYTCTYTMGPLFSPGQVPHLWSIKENYQNFIT